jgi:thiosulfate dehydrogenase [quinone] large subunit
MTTESAECCKSTESAECCKSTESTECCNPCPQTHLGLSYGALLLRVWLAVRAIQTGVEKFAGFKGSDQPVTIDGKANEYGLTAATNIKEYAFSHYHGVPEALYKKFSEEPLMRLPGPLETMPKEFYKWLGGKVGGEKLADAPEAWAKFLQEPLMLNVYNFVLGPALLLLGLTLLFGIASRTSLFLLGLLYVSLTWGLILIKEDSGIAWLGIHVIMIVMALMLSKHNRLCVLKKW